MACKTIKKVAQLMPKVISESEIVLLNGEWRVYDMENASQSSSHKPAATSHSDTHFGAGPLIQSPVKNHQEE